MHNIEIPNKNEYLSLIHMKPCSLNKISNDLQHLLSCTKNNIDLIAVTETGITKQIFFKIIWILINILKNLLQSKLLQMVLFFTLLIVYHINIKITETSKKEWNGINFFYRHRSTDLTDFYGSYLNNILESIS